MRRAARACLYAKVLSLMSDPFRNAATGLQAFIDAYNASEQAEFEDLEDRFWERTSPHRRLGDTT